MATILRELFNTIWRSGRPPRSWLYGVVQYFYKSGPTEDMGNYRGITLLDTVSKSFHQVLATRLLDHAEAQGLLHTAQNAFRRNRSTDDHIYCLHQVALGRKRLKQQTYCFFLDLRKAYDTVWRDGMMYKLWQAGVRGRLWQYIDALYTKSVRQVGVGDNLSGPVTIGCGARRYPVVCALQSLRQRYAGAV